MCWRGSTVEQLTCNQQVVGSIPLGVTICGLIAQLGEHLPYKQRVIGSSPIAPTNFFICGPVVQLVRMPACHAGGRRFEPDPDRQYGGCSQVVKTTGCGSVMRGFESHHPPHFIGV